MKAIADAEDLNVTDEEVEAELQKNAADYGYDDVEEYKSAIDLKAIRIHDDREGAVLPV